MGLLGADGLAEPVVGRGTSDCRPVVELHQPGRNPDASGIRLPKGHSTDVFLDYGTGTSEVPVWVDSIALQQQVVVPTTLNPVVRLPDETTCMRLRAKNEVGEVASSPVCREVVPTRSFVIVPIPSRTASPSHSAPIPTY